MTRKTREASVPDRKAIGGEERGLTDWMLSEVMGTDLVGSIVCVLIGDWASD